MHFKRILPVILSFGVFLGVIYFTPPPKSWAEASVIQILSFFIPLLLFFTFLLHYFTLSFGKSFSISLGAMVLLVLISINELTPLSFVLTATATMILTVSFKKVGLTNKRRSHKLTR